MKPRLGKKAQVSGFISGAFQSVGHFISTLPPIGKTLLFLIFLSILVIFFNFMFGIFGYHCDGNGDLYKVSILRIDQNLQLMTSRPSPDDLASTSFQSPSENFPIQSQRCVITDENDTKYFTGIYCTDCNQTVSFIQPGEFATTEACAGDVQRLSESEKSFWQRMFCTDDTPGIHARLGCDIPINYNFNQTLGGYTCQDLDICGNITVAVQWRSQLEDKGELIPPPPENSRAYDQAFSVGCNGLRPEFRLYGIPIFDYRIWVFITLISVLIITLIKIKGNN